MRWTHWFLVILGAVLVGSYLGLLSWGRVEQALERLASEPKAAQLFQHESVGRPEAMFFVFAFMILTPAATLATLFLAAFVASFIITSLRPLSRMCALPDATFPAVGIGGFLIAIWIERLEWLPSARWLVALVARSFLVAVN